MARAAIHNFELANPIYKNAVVYFYTVAAGVKTAVLADLFYTGNDGDTEQLPNPQKLNSRGNLKQPVYIDAPVIATIEGISVPTHDTGVITPAPTFRVDTTTHKLQYSFDGGVSWSDSGLYFFRDRGAWVTTTAYKLTDMVQEAGASYVCVTEHTSGTFATDLAAGKWVLLTSLDATLTSIAALTGAANKGIYFSGTDTAALYDLSAFGRTWSALADIAAALSALGIGSAGLMPSSSFILQALADAKGDRIYATAADTWARKAAPANGRLATANSAASDGWSDVAGLTKAIHGWTWANNAGDATNDIDIAAGGGMDSTGAFWIHGAAMTKQLDVNWAPGTNQGMRNSAAAITNTGYYIWAVAKADGTQDYYAHASATAATVLAALQLETGGSAYAYLRLIGWINRVGGTIVPFKVTEVNGGGVWFAWITLLADINLTNTLTTSRRTDALRVPLLFPVNALVTLWTSDAATHNGWIGDVDQVDAAPSNTPENTSWRDPSGGGLTIRPNISVKTSAAGLIAARADVATVDSYKVATIGFNWGRRD